MLVPLEERSFSQQDVMRQARATFRKYRGARISVTGSTDISVSESKCPSAGSSNNCPTVSGTVVTKGIKGTAAHIHQGAPGQNGPVIVTLIQVDDSTWAVPSGTTLTGGQTDAFWAGMLYVNVHSDANKGGELRAQLKP